MPTCANCTHVDVCGLRDQLGEYADQCEHFKSADRFVELPCKHDDTIFRISNGKVEKGTATTFFYGKEFHIVNCRFPKINTGIPFHRFGKSVFLTPEEAEQALKEREEHDPN